MYPENYFYTKEHEWVRVEGDIGVAGITDHAQDQLGDIVYVDLPKPGTRVEQGKPLGSVESVKAVSDIYAPVSGEVIEINDALATAPEKLNEDPHGAAWLVKIRLSAPGEIKQLLSAKDYQNYIGAEGSGH
ncbi:MAG TPA: glycine cleavage system protein GcvH [Bryobacteraceae bacterium]|nr:glycine cleavage system protein GcvH [Bryobacteraceae bacterium]